MRASQGRFNLRNTDQQVCVTCLDGAVEVDVEGRSLRLEPGQQVTYDARQVGSVQSVDTAAVMNWRQQVLVFNGATLSQMIDEINRYRPGCCCCSTANSANAASRRALALISSPALRC